MGTHPIFESDFDCLTDNQMLIGLLLGVAVADDNERHRDFVIAMWRHGARSPMVFQPAFGDDLNMWPDGAGQLTAAGRDLHLELGEFLRTRYADLVSSTYRREELLIRSTDRDRTLLSANANLEAFYNYTDHVPIHTVPVADDHLLRFPVTGCRRYSDVSHELHATPAMEALNEQYREYLDQLGAISQVDEPLYVHSMWPYIDSIDCHVANNKTVLNITDDQLTTWRYLAAKGMQSLFTDLEGDRRVEISRLNAGTLLADIVTKMRDPPIQPDIHPKDDPMPVKYLVYSAHDTTLAAAMVAMNVWHDVQPYYASALLFERFSDGSVEIHFRNGSSEANMFDLTGEICSSVPCTIDDLEEVWREVIPLNWDAECHNMDPAPAGVKAIETTNTTLGVLLGLSWAIFIGYALFMRPRRKDSDQMQLIDSEFSMAVDEKSTWQSVPN